MGELDGPPGPGDAPGPAGASRAAVGAGPLRVLIVEDELIIAWEVGEMLARLGCEVCGMAAGAADAIRLAGERRPDLVLMDVRLRRGGDGIAAAEAIMAERPVGVVFCTAYAEDPTTRARMAALAPVGVLSKPILPAALRQVVTLVTRSAPT
jgi:CheY-like chemotaxis protein